jgi:DNA-binding response OmpR family regulator
MIIKDNKKRILVVDDQPGVRTFIQIDLRLRGFDVLTAGSGEEALRIIHAEKPDIMLLDILMPGMSGFDVLEKLRAFSVMPVIAFSASPENKTPAMRAGASQFMHKPFDPDEMARIVESLLNGK